MRPSGAATWITEEPDEGNLHVRICGGIDMATYPDSTRKVLKLCSGVRNPVFFRKTGFLGPPKALEKTRRATSKRASEETARARVFQRYFGQK